MPGFSQITPAQALRLIGTPDAPTVFDVRTDEDVAALPQVIPTSRRLAHTMLDALTGPPGRAIVVCTKGRKLSEGA
ncbi:MAG: sulfurtransferase, partial [Rhodobacteraceae bacterium]|nr:sulfurtransferase [Paracoccaceae bacterium]